ncbi:MAG: ActS/PrrB/RegB family redox-sensitive histidine kinase [Sulfitobacter sp.]
MTQANIRPLGARTRANWIRLHTMILLRWVAITGQLVAITVAQVFYGLQLELGLCYLVVGLSVIGNLIATFIFPRNKRLIELENLAMVLFDLLQLASLLYLTGGLHNPFALLLLGPVTISATALSLRSTLVMCAIAIIVVSVLSVSHLPLMTNTGEILKIPQVFVFGHWIALLIAIVFTSAYSRRVTTEIHSMGDALAATQMALAREQKLTDLGGVIAAAAHELGTPLATIKLTSTELLSDLIDQPELAEDAALIRDQADRCRDILRDMGRSGKDDLHLRHAPLETVVEEAAEPHLGRGKMVHFIRRPHNESLHNPPTVLRKPEIIHGLRNLIQNAVDFADGNVWIETKWTPQEVSVRILDDGKGFPAHVLARIGDPFMRGATGMRTTDARREYQGMGLGLFIAKTLLERSGATLRFANGSEEQRTQNRVGAVIEVIWPREKIGAQTGSSDVWVGQNQHITA